MFKSQSQGKLIPSITMIDSDLDLLTSFRKVFHQFDAVKFFTMNDLWIGLLTASRYGADLIIAEICYPNAGFHDSEHDGHLIHTIRDVRPEAKIIICSNEAREEIIHRYLTQYQVDAYFKKTDSSILDVVRKSFELVGEPSPT